MQVLCLSVEVARVTNCDNIFLLAVSAGELIHEQALGPLYHASMHAPILAYATGVHLMGTLTLSR